MAKMATTMMMSKSFYSKSHQAQFMLLFFILTCIYRCQASSTAETCTVKMTEDELEVYNGTQPNQPIYLSLSGNVYDVSSSPDWYDPNGTYSVFAGRACTRGISLPSMKQEDISDDISDFNDDHFTFLKYWNNFFNEKYPIVAILIPDNIEERNSRIEKHKLLIKEKESLNSNSSESTSSQQQHKDYSNSKIFSELELRSYVDDGILEDDEKEEVDIKYKKKILLSIGGHVLDVTKSSFLYGKNKPRECFAGRSITRISARISVTNKPCDNMDDLNKGNDIVGLTTQELGQLKKKVKFFLEKFERVGSLENVDLILP